jgi:hypothetical protein
VLGLLGQGHATGLIVEAFTGLHEALRRGAAEKIAALLFEELEGASHRC